MTLKVKGPQIGSESIDDDLAKREAVDFSQETLQADEAQQNHSRKQRFHNHLITAIILAFWMGIAVLVGLVFSWLYHILTPGSCHYLSPDQIEKIQTMLFSGLVSGLLTGVAKRYF